MVIGLMTWPSRWPAFGPVVGSCVQSPSPSVQELSAQSFWTTTKVPQRSVARAEPYAERPEIVVPASVCLLTQLVADTAHANHLRHPVGPTAAVLPARFASTACAIRQPQLQRRRTLPQIHRRIPPRTRRPVPPRIHQRTRRPVPPRTPAEHRELRERRALSVALPCGVTGRPAPATRVSLKAKSVRTISNAVACAGSFRANQRVSA